MIQRRFHTCEAAAALCCLFMVSCSSLPHRFDGRADGREARARRVQSEIAKIRDLDPVQPVLAYLGPPETTSDAVVRLYVANVLNLPVEIVGFDVHGATVLPAGREWLHDGSTEVLSGTGEGVVLRGFDRERSPAFDYVRFDVPLTEIHRRDSELDFMQPLDMQVITRIVGLERTQLTLAQEGYPEAHVGGER